MTGIIDVVREGDIIGVVVDVVVVDVAMLVTTKPLFAFKPSLPETTDMLKTPGSFIWYTIRYSPLPMLVLLRGVL